MRERGVTYTIQVHEEGDGSYWAEVQELPGCFASGHTIDELWEGVAEAIGLYLSTDKEQVTVEMLSSDPITVHTRERRVAVC